MARISQTTIDRLEELDLADFAMQLGDQLKREGRHYYTYRNGGEKTPSLCITPEKRMWTAFGSTESGFGAISYFSYRKWNTPKPKGEQFIEAVEAVAQIAGVLIEYEDGKVVTPAAYTGAPRVKAAPKLIRENLKKDNPTLDRFFRRMMREFPLTVENTQHFRTKRQMNDRQIRTREYRSLFDNKTQRYQVADKMMKELGEPEGIPGFAFCKGSQFNYWTILGKAGILLPFRDIYNHIIGFQIRYDRPNVNFKVDGNIKVIEKNPFQVIDLETSEILWEGTEEQLNHMKFENGASVSKKYRWYGWLASNPDPERGILKGTANGDPAPYHAAVPTEVLERWHPGQHISDVMDTSTIWWGEGPIKGAKRSPITA
jgi:hypothetical protein